MEHRFPHRPQLLESLTKLMVLMHRPLQYTSPTEQSHGDLLPFAGPLTPPEALLGSAGNFTGWFFAAAIAALTRSLSSRTGVAKSIATGVPTSRKNWRLAASTANEATNPAI